MSKAAGLPRAQLGRKMSAGRDFHAQVHGYTAIKSLPTHCACSWLWRVTTSSFFLHVVACSENLRGIISTSKEIIV